MPQKAQAQDSSTVAYRRGLVVAGGTGGHIVPGIALAIELKKQGLAEIHFLSLEKDRAYPDLASLIDTKQEATSTKQGLHFYAAPALPTKNKVLDILLFPWRMLGAVQKSYKIIKDHRIDFIVGMGGYPMIPALLSSHLQNKAYYLCEQNAVPGLGTRLFARRAQLLFINFPLVSSHTIKKASHDLIRHSGNPLRPGLRQKSKQEQTKASQNQDIIHILVLGGSQGALQINTMVQQLIPKLGSKYRWTIQCGSAHIDNFTKFIEKLSVYPDLKNQIELLGYSPNIEKYYRQANLIICRAGAGVLSEALCFGLPLLLIPYPYAADSHQEANADYIGDNGAAIVFKQKHSQTDYLEQALLSLQQDKQKLATMAKAALKLARPNAAEDIAVNILKQGKMTKG